MTKIVRVSPEMQKFLAAPESEPVSASAFEAHGFWTLGVVLMRNLQFKAKALLICVMFLLPMGIMAWSYYSANFESIAFSSKERLGVEYNREIFPVLNFAQQLRRDASNAAASGTTPATIAEVKEKLQAAQAKLAAVDKRLGSDLGTAKAYAAVQEAYAKAIASNGAVEVVFKAHTDHVQALLDLMGIVTDSSNLILDPNIASFYVMDAVFVRVSDIVEKTAQLRGRGVTILKSGGITAEQQKSMSELIPVAEYQFSNMNDGLTKANGADKSITDRVKAKEARDATSAFYAQARKTVIDAQDFSPAAQADYLAAANKTISTQYALTERLMDQLDELLAVRVGDMKMHLYFVFAALVIGVLLAFYFFYTFYLVTRGGLILISKHLKEMADGDLRRAPAKPWGRDEPAQVIIDLRHAYDSLHALIRTVRHSARSLHATSAEIASASVDLSARTESAAASLEEQSAAMEEIGSTVDNTAELASLAAKFAADNAKVAEDGGKVIVTVVKTMQEIHSSSSKINDIIGVINGIAFQTNILALNAAVEAARAGDAGRGFAVVASEVRNLAQRSAAAATEIKTLISNSVDQIASGTKVVEQAGTTMTTMVTNAKQINVYLSDISSASREQALGVTQVAAAVHALDEDTQQNAALVEQTTAASGALTQQAETLQHEIANFKVS